MVPDVTPLVPFDVAAGTLDHQHLLGHVGAIAGQGGVNVVLQRYLLATAYGLVGGDDDPGGSVLDPLCQGVRRKAAEYHRVHRTDTGTGQHGHGGFRDHRHVQGHGVTLADPHGLQGVGQLAGTLVQLTVGDHRRFVRIVPFPDDRRLVATLVEVSIQAVGRHVEGAVLEPADVDIVAGKGYRLDGLRRLDPVKACGLLLPEALRVFHRLLIELVVGGLVGPGGLGKRIGNRIDVLMIAHGALSLDTHRSEEPAA